MQPAKILVADDEQNLRHVLTALLRREGHDVLQAPSGTEGMEVLRTASKNHPHIPVIMITAYGSVGQAVEAIKAGAFDYIEKPFEQEAIRIIVEKAIGQATANKLAPTPTLYAGGDTRGERFGLVGNSPQMHAIFDIIEK